MRSHFTLPFEIDINVWHSIKAFEDAKMKRLWKVKNTGVEFASSQMEQKISPPPKYQLLVTPLRLCLGLLQQDLSYRLGTSVSVVCNQYTVSRI